MLLRISAFFILLRPALSERHRMCSAAPPRSVCQIRKLPALSRNGRAGSFIADLLCQCPKRADFISTFQNVFTLYPPMALCQCPKRADFISTWRNHMRYGFVKTGVNALSGLISFLRDCSVEARQERRHCVNALSGLISFLPTLLAPALYVKCCVSMP